MRESSPAIEECRISLRRNQVFLTIAHPISAERNTTLESLTDSSQTVPTGDPPQPRAESHMLARLSHPVLRAVFVGCLVGICIVASATAQSPGGDTAKTLEDDSQEAPAEATEAEIAEWIESLGSRDFAARERAAGNLASLGKSVIARLREVASGHQDPEIRLRASEIVKQLTRGDMRSRIEAFLAGKDVSFDGWTLTQAIMGDSNGVRELFVAMLTSYPDLMTAMEGTPRDRALALEKTVGSIEQKMFVKRQAPEAADAIALLLPAIDPNVPLEGAYENILMAVLQKSAVSDIHRNAQLSAPFHVLLGRWMSRSSVDNREEVLFYGLSWHVTQTRALAIRTLREVQQTETLTLAFQAIARFGSEDDSAEVARFLDDKRPAAERGFANGKRLRAEVGDIAMATIARLHDVRLTKIGFAKDSVDDRFAFLIDDLGFPVDDETLRKAARAKIDALIKVEIKGSPLEGL